MTKNTETGYYYVLKKRIHFFQVLTMQVFFSINSKTKIGWLLKFDAII